MVYVTKSKIPTILFSYDLGNKLDSLKLECQNLNFSV